MHGLCAWQRMLHAGHDMRTSLISCMPHHQTLEFGTSAKSGVGVIQRPDEILVTLEENMAMLQSMQGQGKYVEHFIGEVNKWQKLLNQAETVLYDWLDVQSKWSALEAIFMGSADIRVQLPEDSARFDAIDTQWKHLMSHAKNTPNVIEACSTNNRSEILGTMKGGLEMCEKSLFQYLETKRKVGTRGAAQHAGRCDCTCTVCVLR